MLMHFVVAASGLRHGQTFVTTQSMAKQAKIPIRIIRMAQPAPEKHETPVDPIADDIAGVRNRTGKLGLRFGRQNFIGIEDKHPIVLERKILDRPVLLFRPCPVEVELRDFGTVLLRDLSRAVGAVRIDHQNLVRPLHAFEATWQIFRFVLDRDQDRDRHSRSHRVRKTLHGLPARSIGTSRK